MPRKKIKKAVDTLASLEALSRDESMPLAVREEAGRELVRLTVKDKPVAVPTPVAPVLLPDWSGFAAEAAAIQREIAKTKPVNPANPESESQTFLHDAEIKRRQPESPEPVEEPKPVKPVKPYIWRNERGESEDQIKARLWREKCQASNEFYRQLSGGRREGEWPGT